VDPAAGARALDEMRAAGATVKNLAELLAAAQPDLP
jgi:hypothetical protein